MRAFTVWPEWAWGIVRLDKRHENRTFAPPPAVRGRRVAVHAGKYVGGPGDTMAGIEALTQAAERAGWSTGSDPGVLRRFAKDGRQVDLPEVDAIPRFAIVGTVVIRSFAAIPAGDAPRDWRNAGGFAWELDELRVLEEPIRTSGALGVWTVPDDVFAEIRRQGCA